MLRHSLEGSVILFSLQHLIAPALDLMPCLPSGQRREAIKALKLFDIILGKKDYLINCGPCWI